MTLAVFLTLSVNKDVRGYISKRQLAHGISCQWHNGTKGVSYAKFKFKILIRRKAL
jgi:hypothetical protein